MVKLLKNSPNSNPLIVANKIAQSKARDLCYPIGIGNSPGRPQPPAQAPLQRSPVIRPPFRFPQPPELELSIVIVSFNTRDHLVECLDSVYRNTPKIKMEIRVVDNHSDDHSLEAVQKKFPDVLLEENSFNRGFSAGCNEAIRKCRGKYVVLLNPDTRLIENSFQKIIDYLNVNTDVFILSPAILDANGGVRPMRHREDGPMDAARRILGRCDSARDRAGMATRTSKEVQVVGGACFVVRRDLFESIGLLDENYFLYNEEDDFCRRARQAGAKIAYFPETKIRHYQGQSTHQPGVREKVIVESYKSDLYFFSKHYNWFWNVFLRVLYRISFAAGMLRSLVRRVSFRATGGAEDSLSLKWKLLWM